VSQNEQTILCSERKDETCGKEKSGCKDKGAIKRNAVAGIASCEFWMKDAKSR
jgi:hypothetical protein